MYDSHTVFSAHHQAQFARVSADFNPVHVDPVAARRTVAGAPIVHGMHSLLWLLDRIASSHPAAGEATGVKAQFVTPIYVGDEVSLEILSSSGESIRARLRVDGEDVLLATLAFGNVPSDAFPAVQPPSRAALPPTSPVVRELGDMANVSGTLAFDARCGDLQGMFPSATTAFGLQRLGALASLSCLVGMVVPGLHSMFSGVDLSFREDVSLPGEAIQYAVASVTPRFRLVGVAVRSASLRGTLQTINRLPPVRQSSLAALKPLIAADEFRQSLALVVGGSRGLGELTAKLIAAGGGRVILTYASGEADAAAVAEEIREGGAECSVMRYDVRRGAKEQLASLIQAPTHVYYFATPQIFRRKAGIFDSARYAEFSACYVNAFFDLVQACVNLRPEGVSVFYPSSIAVETRPATMTEYTMAKAAGEVLCADLGKVLRGVQITVRRLPRLPTDQTNSTASANNLNPVEVMLPIVRDVHRGKAGSLT
jgi:NADP-dependent 3-hydroxy acid dehydrogenase YdfG